MERNRFDNFERLIRRKLEEESEKPAGWNTPPEDVFEQAMDKLPPLEKKRKRRGLIFFFTGALMLIGALLAGLTMYNKIEALNSRISELTEESRQNALSIIEDRSDESEIQTTNQSDKITSQLLNVQNSHNDKAQIKAETFIAEWPSPSNRKSPVENSHQSTPVDGDQKTGVKGEPEQNVHNNSPLHQTSIRGASSQGIGTSDLNSIYLPIGPLSSFEISTTLPALRAPSIKLSDTNRKTKGASPQIYAYGGINFSSMRMSNVSGTKELTGYDSYCPGYQFGLGADFTIGKRWKLNTEIAYSGNKNVSNYRNQMPYDKNNEQVMPDGERFYSTSVKIESPMHEMSSSAEFDLGEEVISENDMLENITDIETRFNTIGVRLGVEYNLLNAGKFSISSGVGLGVRYLSCLEESTDMKIYHDGAMMMRENGEYGSMHDVNRVLGSAYGAINFEYSLSSGFYLIQRSMYEMGLNSIRKTTSASEVKTYMDSLRLSIGLAYRF